MGETPGGHETVGVGDGDDDGAGGILHRARQFGINPAALPEDPEILDKTVDLGPRQAAGNAADEAGERGALRLTAIDLKREAGLVDQMAVEDELPGAGRLRPDG